MGDLLVYTFLSIPLIGAFSMFAIGISVIYRASRVLNLSHGAMAMVPAYIFHTLVTAGIPMPFALVLSVASGTLLGILVERIFVRRLRPQGPTAQTVGTVAVTGLLIALTAKVWGTASILAPQVFPTGELRIAGAAVRYGDIGLFFVGIVASGGLFAFFRFTEIGLAMRGAAQNRRAASLMGIDPDAAAAAAWGLGGGLAGLAGILLAAVTNLDPYNLPLQVLPAFVAALIGSLESLPGAMWGSALAGLLFGVVPALTNLPLIGRLFRYSGSTQLLLTILAMIVMVARGRRFSVSQESDAGLTTGTSLTGIKKLRLTPGTAAAGLALLLWPFIVPFSVVGTSLLAIEYALIAISLVVLIGWVGQISLAQASFVGIGALSTGLVTRGLDLGFPANMLISATLAAGAAAALGFVALRVRGLYLAVATLIFAWMADQFLFPSPWLGASTGSSTIPGQRIGLEGGIPSFDLTSRKTLYFVMLAVLIAVISALANLRDTKTGRAFFAVRGSETAAASLGIDVIRYKLAAFALSGLLAGIGGALLMMEQRTVVPSQFFFTVSLQYLAIVVVGGLASIGGAIASGVLFAGLNELFFRVPSLSGWLEVVSAALLAVVLLAQPGGLAAVATTFARNRRRVGQVVRSGLERLGLPLEDVVQWVVRLRRSVWARPAGSEDWFAAARERATALLAPSAPSTNGHGPGPAADEEPAEHPHLFLGFAPTVLEELPLERGDRRMLLEGRSITVRFGGLTAVSEATLTVREGEITGLIGPNGAGKTTLFNALLGLNSPSAGEVRLFGTDVTNVPPHMRAQLGVARTFQVLQLFYQLSVFDNLLVATHLHNPSGMLGNFIASNRTLAAEKEVRDRVQTVLELLGLQEVARDGVSGLPFGTLRKVELGRALVTGARVLLLDEIASGLNESETDQLSQVIEDVRDLGVSVLLIEHDIRMVTTISDHVYVLNQGRMIAGGSAADIQQNDEVIAAYLGQPAGSEEEEESVAGAGSRA